MQQNLWTEQEQEILKQNIEHLTHSEIATLLPGRTTQSVNQKCKQLKLLRGYSLPDKTILPPVPLEKVIYFAGHFDGEGCIAMRDSGKSYKIFVTITAAYLPVLELYKNFFGGNICKSTGTNKPLWKWMLHGYKANLFFLETLYPYLLEKNLQAEVALDFIKIRILASHGHPTQDIRELGHQCYLKLKELKRL
jgi:hypothetical protein